VTGRHKRSIEDHFDAAYELEAELEAAGKNALLDVVRSIKPEDMDCIFIRQPRALGLGHAVLCAENLVGNEPFAVLLADDLMVGEPPVLKQMIQSFSTAPGTVVAVQEVPREHTRRYGIVSVQGHRAYSAVDGIVEKPAPEDAPSTLGVAGRYILSPGIFQSIRSQPSGVGGEIQLTDGIAGLIGREPVYSFRYTGKRYDCGSKDGFLQATIDLALANPDLADSVREHMRQILTEA
jgi:UTP--glucose-1-phosphate uridylyltransferase